MPHIHTEPGQHDMTVSAYIVRRSKNGEWLCLVHMHKKVHKLMQIGGHIELHETPWQAVTHELQEESGYTLPELLVAQYTADVVEDDTNVTHPVPFSTNTHLVKLSAEQGGYDHYHSDLCYGFVAKDVPQSGVKGNESKDLRWLSIAELEKHGKAGEALMDVFRIYKFLLAHIDSMHVVDPTNFSTKEPTKSGFRYLQ